MARSKPEPTPEELEERRERYDAYLAEAVVKPLGWFKHDADAHDDPKLQDLRDMLGMAGYGRYWLLVEVLAGREAHQYAVEDRATGRDRWARLAMELEFDGGITQAKAFVGMLDELGLVYPADGTSCVPDGSALVAGCAHEENARRFLDFTVSADVQRLLASRFYRRSVRADVPAAADMPALKTLRLLDYDVGEVSARREALLMTWAFVFGGEGAET